MSSQSRDYSFINHFLNGRPFALSNIRKEYYYGPGGDGGDGVGPRTTHLSTPNDSFGRDRKYWGFQKYQHERKSSFIGSLRNGYYQLLYSDCFLFGFSVGDGKGCMGPNFTQLTSHNVYCWIDGGDFVELRSWNYAYMIHSYNGSSYHSSIQQ